VSGWELLCLVRVDLNVDGMTMVGRRRRFCMALVGDVFLASYRLD
jgi:hypothetical protein